MGSNQIAAFPSDYGLFLRIPAPPKARELSTDTRTFWELASPHQKKLYNFISKALSFSERADDVFQETLFRGMKYFGSYKKDKDFAAWLFTIAHNEIKKHHKNERSDTLLPLYEGLVAPEDKARRDLVLEVYRFAEGLSPKHREVFFLFYDSGFSVKEIARITNLGEGNVKFLLNRARNFLKQSLGESNGRS